MKSEMQTFQLEKMMQKYKLYPEYELILPFIQVKISRLEKLTEGDILLLGVSNIEIIILHKDKVCAKGRVSQKNNTAKISTMQNNEKSISLSKSKKYDIVKCSFCVVQIRRFEVGDTIEVESLNPKEINLIVKNRNIAKGALVNVDGEMAIQIGEITI